jgi:hypothetical protein
MHINATYDNILTLKNTLTYFSFGLSRSFTSWSNTDLQPFQDLIPSAMDHSF